MGRFAFGCIEKQDDGRWICLRATTVPGRFGPIEIKRGQSFQPNSKFGGFDNFTAYLASVSIDSPPKSPHEW